VSPFSERNAMFAEGLQKAFVTSYEITRDNLEGHNLRYYLTKDWPMVETPVWSTVVMSKLNGG